MTNVTCGILGVVCKLWFNAFPVSVTVYFCEFVCERVRVRENEYMGGEGGEERSKEGKTCWKRQNFYF